MAKNVKKCLLTILFLPNYIHDEEMTIYYIKKNILVILVILKASIDVDADTVHDFILQIVSVRLFKSKYI